MHLNFTSPDGYVFYLGNLIAFVIIFGSMFWFCIEVLRHNITPVAHSVIFAIITIIAYWLGSTLSNFFPHYWWTLTPFMMLAGLARETYNKVKHDDFGWDHLLYDFVGTFAVTTFYWASHIVK